MKFQSDMSSCGADSDLDVAGQGYNAHSVLHCSTFARQKHDKTESHQRGIILTRIDTVVKNVGFLCATRAKWNEGNSGAERKRDCEHTLPLRQRS